MIYRLIIRPEAENDLKEAFSWYESNRSGLGFEFIIQVDAGLKFLKENPLCHPIEFNDTRKHLVRRFPYKIIYLVQNEKIIVLAVLHEKRNPSLLMNRIDNS